MQCKNHPEISAIARCEGCQESFCTDCLVGVGGQQYCASCKVMAVQGAPIPEQATIPCKEAKDALILSIVGIFCFGIILGPIALVKASKAKKEIAANPRLTGSGQATAATVISIIVIVLSVLGLIVNFANIGSGDYGNF